MFPLLLYLFLFLFYVIVWIGNVAQLVERKSHNLKVVSSILTVPTFLYIYMTSITIFLHLLNLYIPFIILLVYTLFFYIIYTILYYFILSYTTYSVLYYVTTTSFPYILTIPINFINFIIFTTFTTFTTFYYLYFWYMCSRYHPPLYLCTYLIMGIWRNGNASDFGSEDCRFDPCYARLFIYNLSLYYIYTFIYTIILILFILYILYTILFIHYTLYTIIIFIIYRLYTILLSILYTL